MENIIALIEEKLAKYKTEIWLKDAEIITLKDKLAEAEKEIERLKGSKENE